MKHLLTAATALALSLSVPAHAVPPTYSIADIFAEPGLTGYGPENLEWSHDGKHLTYFLRNADTKLADLYMVDADSGQTTLLMSGSQLAGAALPPSAIKNQRLQEWVTRYGVASYHWARDSKSLYYQSNDQVYLFHPGDPTITQITHEDGDKEYPEISPDGRWIAYLSNGDLRYAPVAGNAAPTPVAPHVEGMLNGMLDWVYAEELALRSAYAWSDDSRYIAYLQFDERPVHPFPLVSDTDLQPDVFLEYYPLTGAPNPLVKLGLRDLQSGKTVWLPVGGDPNSYLARFGWLPDHDQVWALVLNRAQTEATLYVANADGSGLHTLASFKDPWWVSVESEIRFLKDGRFLWTTTSDGWTHLYLFDAHGKTVRKLTDGSYNVVDFAGIDEDKGLAYYTRYAKGPMDLQLYSVPIAGGAPTLLTPKPGDHQIKLSETGGHFVDAWSDSLMPPETSLRDGSGKQVALIQASAKLPYDFVKPQFFTITAGDGATPLYAEMILPPGFDPHKKYPVIMYQYGGPDVPPSVKDEWGGTGMLYNQLLAAQGYILFVTDNRAATYYSHADQAKVKLHLGKIALEDQLAAVSWLKHLPTVDSTRIGLWGWSFGGYMTDYALTRSPGTWKAGISVAPVTQWEDYDSIYTERYMSTPALNPLGYADSSAVASAKALQDPLLIVVGSGDDNVHWQNSLQFIQGLIDADRPYQLLIYPNMTHGINGPKARTHLFTAMQDYWKTQLQPGS